MGHMLGVRGEGSGVRGQGSGVTFGVVEDPLDDDGVLCDSLGHQQDAFLDAMTTQQRAAADTLSIMGWRETKTLITLTLQTSSNQLNPVEPS